MNKRLLTVVALGGILAAGWYALRPSGEAPGMRAERKATPLAVDVATVRQQAVPYLWRAVGQVEPFHTVTVRPQVTGMLDAVAFTEGDRVSQGQLLFRVDPAPFAAAVAQAKAQLAKDKAVLSNAKWQEERQRGLQGKSFASAQDFENAKALVAETEAAIALDEAALKQAQIKLGYCEIRAPIDGYTGALAVKAGNLIQESQTTPLVTINQVTPALVRLSVPQSELETVRASQKAGNAITVRLHGVGDRPLEGNLVFVDNTIDSKTGTIALKARIDNDGGELWPGQYVDVDLISGIQPDALVIPETALQQGQDGPFVYLVQGGHARLQPVKVGRQVGGEVVIAGGLSAGAQVVSRVPRRLEDGSAVEPHPAK